MFCLSCFFFVFFFFPLCCGSAVTPNEAYYSDQKCHYLYYSISPLKFVPCIRHNHLKNHTFSPTIKDGTHLHRFFSAYSSFFLLFKNNLFLSFLVGFTWHPGTSWVSGHSWSQGETCEKNKIIYIYNIPSLTLFCSFDGQAV